MHYVYYIGSYWGLIDVGSEAVIIQNKKNYTDINFWYAMAAP